MSINDKRVSLERLQKNAGVTDEQLDLECSDADLDKLARSVAHYYRYARALGLKDADIQEIDQDVRVAFSTKDKMRRVFEVWKSAYGDTASYRFLVKVAVEFGDGILGREICQLCAGTPLSQDDTDALERLLREKQVDSEVLASTSSELTLERVQQALRAKGRDHLADNLRQMLDDIIGEQRRYLKLLEEFMTSDDTVKVRYLKLFMVGPPGVGKTTTLSRLLKKFENLHKAGNNAKFRSTLLANCTQVLALVKERAAEWLSCKDLDEETRLLFRYVCENKSNDAQPKPSQKTAELVTKEKPTNMPRKSQSTSRGAEPHTKAATPKAVAQQLSKVQQVISQLQKVVKDGDYSKVLHIFRSTLLNIHDIGGQPGFLEMLPALSSGPAMYLVFFALNKELDQLYKIPFSRDNTTITPYDAMHTVKTTISQILSSITSVHCISQEPAPFQMERAPGFSERFKKYQEVRPVATLIGTHKDELEEPVEEKLEQKNKALKKVTDKFSKIIVKPSSEKSFFAVDNKYGTEQSDISPIRTFLNKTFNTCFKDASLPVRSKWLLLSVVLRKECSIISMEDCLEIMKVLNMHDKEEVEFCLWYLHHCIGTLMYYPGVPDPWFKDHVICSMQVIFDSISQLIVASLRTLHSEGPCLDCDRKDWIQKGQFSIESIEKYCASADIADISELIPAKKLVKLLQHVNLLSPITHSETDDMNNDQTMYIMPAVLECASLDELKTAPQPDSNHPESLYITFECGFVPTGTFCGLITRLISLGPSRILGLKWQLEEDRVKRNCISFHIEIAHTVTLLSHEGCYEIRVVRGNERMSLHDLCTHVLSVVLYVLKNLYKHLVPMVAFQCPCSKHETSRDLQNLCVIKKELWLELVCGKKPVDKPLRQHQRVWLGKDASPGSHVSLEVLKHAEEGFSFCWTKEGSRRPIKTTIEPNVLTFQSVSEEDYGHYQCEVKQAGKVLFTAYRALYREEPTSRSETPMDIRATTVPAVQSGSSRAECRSLTIESLKERFCLGDDQLSSEIEESDLFHLSGCFDAVNPYLVPLGLDNADRADALDKKFQHGTRAGMTEALGRWRSVNPYGAKYRKLLEILVDMNKGNVAEEVCKCLSKKCSDCSMSTSTISRKRPSTNDQVGASDPKRRRPRSPPGGAPSPPV